MKEIGKLAWTKQPVSNEKKNLIKSYAEFSPLSETLHQDRIAFKKSLSLFGHFHCCCFFYLFIWKLVFDPEKNASLLMIEKHRWICSARNKKNWNNSYRIFFLSHRFLWLPRYHRNHRSSFCWRIFFSHSICWEFPKS